MTHDERGLPLGALPPDIQKVIDAFTEEHVSPGDRVNVRVVVRDGSIKRDEHRATFIAPNTEVASDAS